MANVEIDALIERLRRGRCVLCAGNRLGLDGDYRGLVAKLIAGLPGAVNGDAKHVLEHRPLAAAGFVRRQLGDKFAKALEKASRVSGELPETMRLLGELPFRAIVTTSYNDGLERAFTRNGAAPKVYTPRDHDELRKDGKLRYVFKALGDPAREETIVWSAEDVQTTLADGGYYTVSQDLYRSRSFLFLGFEDRDPDLGILLDRILSGAQAGDVEHYAVLPGLSQMERDELYAAYRIRVLTVADAATLARSLHDAITSSGEEALPDDEDVEAWLTLLSENPERQDVLDGLSDVEKALRKSNSHERLIELLLGRVDFEPSPARRAQFLTEVARLFEKELNDLSKAFTALMAAYKEDPRPETWEELSRQASAGGTWAELLTEMTELVPSLPEPARADAWLRIARLYSEKLSNPQSALTSVQEALSLEKVSERRSEIYLLQGEIYENLGDGAKALLAYKEAAAASKASPAESQAAHFALESLLRKRNDFVALITVLDGKAALAGPDEALEIRREVAEIFAEKLSDRRAALARYEALAAEMPKDLTILRALERLNRDEGRHEQYLDALARQAEAVESDKERAALYRRLGSEWEEHPGSQERAATFWEKLLALDPRSEDAFRSLERIYRNEHNWESLIETLERHTKIVPPAIRGEIYAQIGATYADELRNLKSAIAAYSTVEETLPNHAESLSALSKLYERTLQFDKLSDILKRRAGLSELRPERVELLHRAGQITAERLNDAKTAETLFVEALELESTHVPSMTALVEIYRKNGEFLRAAKLLSEAVPHTANRLEKTRLLVEAGEIYDGLEDPRKATELYLEALSVDPEHVEAGERVAELLWKSERYTDLVPVLEMLTRKESEPHVLIERLVRLGRAALAIKAPEKAHKAFAKVSDIDPTNLEAQRGRAEWHFQKQEWAEARAAYAQVEEHHAEELPPSERTELYYALGLCQQKLGNSDAAKDLIVQALSIDPAHRPSLLLQMDLGAAAPESLIDAKQALLSTANSDEKVRLLSEIGDLYREKLDDSSKAVRAYREALTLKPESQRLLHKCLDIYSTEKLWTQALEMLEALIATEKNPLVRAKYRHAAGLICRDELGRPEDAAKLLAASLDDDANFERSAQALEELYTERQEWKELARYYRKAIKRIGAEVPGTNDGKTQERLRLWSALAEICMEKLGERESALAALEVALTLDGRNLDRHKRLADLYVQAGPDSFEKAIVEHQAILRSEKQRVLSYRALKHLYIQTNQREKSIACSYALQFLKKGEPDDAKKVEEYKGKQQAQVRRPLNDEMWSRLAHPDEDRVVGALFSAVGPMLSQAQAQPHKQFNLNRKDALDTNDGRTFSRLLRYATGNLAVATPECYLRADQKEPMQFVNCIDKQTLTPSFILGGPMFAQRADREILFDIARRVTYLRPERFLHLVLPQAVQLAHIIEAATHLSTGKEAGGEVGKTVAGLKRALSPVQLEQVSAIGRKLAESGIPAESAALSWLQASDLTSARAGLILTGDLETAARLLAAEAASSTTLPAMQRLLDLVWSSVTEEIFAVRKHLGVL